MYIAINKTTNKEFEFTWLSDDSLSINNNVVNKNEYEIIEVDDNHILNDGKTQK